ncbi:MAG: TetR/AcrR family transcriptional regulator [Kordiimonadaceae bacterium]|nr:TetR/AcrR family transcriptional regulator [Kordiimonadaceae bacterium]MBO6569623.1 TetR/AcrR family transcriptional regulator [Kordiimonadaceae bacterium]MBO6966158.1 TetR/AcrR family transcriptional regulator [Kordiimonadaceae bacterium]
MGRPTKFNRDDAIELAMNTFWEKGFEPTSVSDLASAMSITRSSFYNSFESREAIFDEALVRYQNSGTSLILTPDLEGFCPVRATRKFFYDVCQNLVNDEDAKGCLIINCYVQAAPDMPAPAGVHSFIDNKRDQFEFVARVAQENGSVSHSQNPATIADALVALLVGVNVMGKEIRDADRLWASAEATLTALGITE